MPSEVRTCLVVGCGLIGTSVALALRSRGTEVYLADRNHDAVRAAAARDAGSAEPPPERVDVVLVAVSPASTADVVVDLLRRQAADTVVDAASVKGPIARAVIAAARGDADIDVTAYVGSHPMAGSERSGPDAARKDLFQGRTWVLTPGNAGVEHVARASRMVELCGAVAVVREVATHDAQVALVSHLPQVVASLLAARLSTADGEALQLAGAGLRDTTRIAASAPDLWTEILLANAGAVAGVLADLGDDLDAIGRALAAVSAGSTGDASAPAAAAGIVRGLLVRGNVGRARLDPPSG